jgi:alpha-beta hydrolase superfamily lysophospholipase
MLIRMTKTLWVTAACVAMTLPVSAKAIETDDPKMLKGLGIPTYVWRDDKDNKPQAIVVGFHSGCLHGKSFDTLARQLAERDVMFVSFDMRGYGKWYHDGYGTEADRTFNYTRTIDDIKRLLATLHKEFPGTRVYCIGESLGANLAMVVAHDMPTQTNGVILVSPYFVARKWLSPRFFADAAHIITHPKGQLELSPYLKNRLASDRSLAEQEVNDPESRNQQTVKELGQSMILNWSGRKKIRKIDPNVAVLILHGKQDELCNPKGTVHAFEHIPSTNKQLVLVERLGHLAAESREISPVFFAALISWIDSTVSIQP